MKKFLLALFSLSMLLAAPASLAVAQDDDDMKPLVLLWAKSYQELIDDINFMGKASDNPNLGDGIEGLLNLVTQGQGIPGLDKDKPWGAAVSSNGFEFQILGFLPISELDKFIEMIGQIAGAPEKEDDDVYKISVESLPSVYLKQVGDWTYVSQAPEGFADVPEDPTKLLNGLEKEYDMGLRAYIQNIPEIFRQLAVEQIKVGMDENLERLPNEGDAQYELRKQMTRDQFEKLTTQMDEMDQITLGVTIDAEKEIGIMELTMTALKDSSTAEQLARMSDGKTNFAGFIKPDSKASANLNLVLSQDDITEIASLLEQAQTEVFKQVDGLDVIPDEGIRKQLKDLLGEFFDIVRATAESGRLDGGLALVGDGPHTLVAGAYVSEGEALSKWFEKLVNMAETEAGFYGVQLDVAKHEGIRFHSVTLPFIGGEEFAPLIELFGDELEVVVGIGEKSAYLAIGKDGVDHLKTAIDESKAAADKEVPPVQAHFALGTFIKLGAKAAELAQASAGDSDEDDDNGDAEEGDEGDAEEGEGNGGGGIPGLAGLPNPADMLEPLMDAMMQNIPTENDQIDIVAKPIENGIRVRVEAEKGVLGFITTVFMTAAPAMNLPGLPQ